MGFHTQSLLEAIGESVSVNMRASSCFGKAEMVDRRRLVIHL